MSTTLTVNAVDEEARLRVADLARQMDALAERVSRLAGKLAALTHAIETAESRKP